MTLTRDRRTAVQLEDVHITYTHGDVYVQAVRGISLEILKGEFEPGAGVKIDCHDGQFTFDRDGDAGDQVGTAYNMSGEK